MGSGQTKPAKVKICTRVVGETLESHEQFIKKLKKRGAKVAEGDSDVVIVFCPIVSRFMTDVQSALSEVSGSKKIILVAMHCTYDPNYTLPDYRHIDGHKEVKVVECLFFEKKGLLECRCNDLAVDAVCKELNLPTKKATRDKDNKKLNKKDTTI